MMDELEYLKRRVSILEQVVQKILGFELQTAEYGTNKYEFLDALTSSAQMAKDNLDAEREDLNNSTVRQEPPAPADNKIRKG